MTNPSPKISVIIPIYNAENYLSRCIESIIFQDYSALEIICIDDGSKDQSLNILRKFANKDKRIKIFSQFNQGAAYARNNGLKHATGDYISFVDADDYIAQGLYSYFAKQISNEPIDIFMFNGSICTPAINQRIPHCFFSPQHFNHHILPTETFDCKSIPGLFYCSAGVWNKIFNHEFLSKHKIKFIENNHFEDIPFNFACFCYAKKIKLTYDDYYFYMQENPLSVTKLFGKNAFEIFEVFANLDKTAEKAGLKEYFAYALFQHKYEKINELIHKASPDIKKRFFEKGQKLLSETEKHLNKNIYHKLKHYSIANNIINNNFDDFWGAMFLLSHKDTSVTTAPKDPMFSVIVPFYNVEQYIEDCLRSILAQTYDNFEVICVDDGSPDKSIDIVERYAKQDKRIKIISQSNKGLGGARNTGAQEAKGQYLFFVDSDDWLHPNTLEKLHHQIIQDPKDVYLFGFCTVRDEMNAFAPEKFASFLSSINPTNWKDLIPIMFIYSTAWCKIYNRTFWKKNKFEFPEKVCFEDICLNTQILINSNSLGFVPNNLYYYRIRQNSIMQSEMTEKKISDLFLAFDSTYEYIKKIPDFHLLKKAFFHFTYNALMLHKNKINQKFLSVFFSKIKTSSLWIDISTILSNDKTNKLFDIHNVNSASGGVL